MPDDDLKAEIDKCLKKYLDEKMGGSQTKTKRFLQQYNTLSERAFSILKRMVEEFKTCDFEPTDFELKIGRDGRIRPYIVQLDDGGVLELHGIIDRVDTMEKDGKKYLRIIDYKSNGKTFDLSKVFYGLNMQMLIYLFALYANGRKEYGDFIPSGIFYMSAKTEKLDLPRDATQEQIDKKRLFSEKNKYSGMVVDDITAIEGMEKDLKGLFVPFKREKDGTLSGKIIPFDKLLKLNEIIDNVLNDTAILLHNGIINAVPYKDKSENACEYCDYKTVCGFEEGDRTLEVESMSFDEALAAIGGDDEAENQSEGGENNG